MNTIYKSPEVKEEILNLYDARLKACNIEFEDMYVDTFAGKTHIVASGDKSLPPIAILHGINAGAPMALEAIKGLNKQYCIYGLDTVGQATKSAENRLPLKGEAYGKWIAEVMDKLHIQKAPVIGVSYGGFLLQKLMSYYPEKITKAILVVPGGFVNGPILDSMKKLSFPLMKFLRSKTEQDLVKFMDAFYSSMKPIDISFQKTVLLGIKMDYRRPPLLKPADVKNLQAPVYVMVAGDDIFFPGDKTLERCKSLFKTLKGYHILKNSKHIPAATSYAEIESQIGKWLAE
jgi:pimeloyl-ACP methyl ester carboxylesterase